VGSKVVVAVYDPLSNTMGGTTENLFGVYVFDHGVKNRIVMGFVGNLVYCHL